MEWQTYSLRFRQTFANGYRYLDKCGEFILAAVDEYDLLPTDTKTSGAILSIPEKSISINVDSLALDVVQEQPVDEAFFLEVAFGVAGLAHEKFGPLHVESNLIEVKLFSPVKTADQVLRKSLQIPGYDQQERAKEFGMAPEQQRVDVGFVSGSTRLRVVVSPTTFETINYPRRNATPNSTQTQIRRASRLTAQADRIPRFDPHAIFLEIALVEMEPPLSSEEALYKLAQEKIATAKRLYSLE